MTGKSPQARRPAGDPAGRPAGVEGGWRRVHRATPLLRSWGVFAVIIVAGVRSVVENVGQGDEGIGWLVDSGIPWLPFAVVGGILVIVALAGLWMYISWRHIRYRVTREAVHVEHGVFFKQQRQARLDRVQSIDVVQPLLGRIFGLAQLKFEAAGGSDSKVTLSYLALPIAEDLRASLLAGAAGLDVDEGTPAPRAPENELLRISPLKILGAQLLTVPGLVLPAALVVMIVISIATRTPALLGSIIPIAFGFGAYTWQRFSTESNFTIAASPDGIRIRSGLLETNAQTVPPGRIQAIGFSQPFLWRLPGWWRVSVNLASLSAKEGMSRGVILPVGSKTELLSVMSLALPDPGVDDALGLVETLMYGRRDDGEMVPVPKRARWLDPLAYRRTAFFVTTTAVAVRTGRINRGATWVPHVKTQSLHLRQGPLQRRFDLATVTLDTTVGPVAPRIKHLVAGRASEFVHAQARRARGARSDAGPELWMRSPDEPAGGTP